MATTAKKPETRKVSPLFREPIGEDNGAEKYLYADEIDRVQIYRQGDPRARGVSKRYLILPHEFRDKKTKEVLFEIDPYETDEGDIHEFFGDGEYYIEPIGIDGKLLHGGRSIKLGDGRHFEDDEEEEEDDQSQNPWAQWWAATYPGVPMPPMTPGMPGMPSRMPGAPQMPFPPSPFGFNPWQQQPQPNTAASVQDSQNELIRKLVDEQVKSASARADDANRQAQAVLAQRSDAAGHRDDLVAGLRNELDEAIRNAKKQQEETLHAHRVQLETALANHRDEMNRKSAELESERKRRSDDVDDERKRRINEVEDERKRARSQVENAQEEFSSKRRTLEMETQRLIIKSDEDVSKEKEERRRQVDEERRRYDRDMQEERQKRTTELDDVRSRLQSRIGELEKTKTDIELKLNKRIDEMSRENLDLRQELAERPKAKEEDSDGAPEAPSPDADAPYWFKAAARYAPMAMKMVGDMQKQRPQQPQQVVQQPVMQLQPAAMVQQQPQQTQPQTQPVPQPRVVLSPVPVRMAPAVSQQIPPNEPLPSIPDPPERVAALEQARQVWERDQAMAREAQARAALARELSELEAQAQADQDQARAQAQELAQARAYAQAQIQAQVEANIAAQSARIAAKQANGLNGSHTDVSAGLIMPAQQTPGSPFTYGPSITLATIDDDGDEEDTDGEDGPTAGA